MGWRWLALLPVLLVASTLCAAHGEAHAGARAAYAAHPLCPLEPHDAATPCAAALCCAWIAMEQPLAAPDASRAAPAPARVALAPAQSRAPPAPPPRFG